MFKVLWFLSRKKGITREEFREHYEQSHAVLAHEYIGHLLIEYRRNYCVGSSGGGVPTDPGGSGLSSRRWEYDCVAEWVMADENAFEEILAVFADPVVGKIFHDDEEHFLDRSSVVLVKYDTRDTGTGTGQKTLALRAR
jgi:hypothetical protein